MKKEKKVVDLEKKNNRQIQIIHILLIVFVVIVGTFIYLILNDEKLFKEKVPEQEVPKEEEKEEIPKVENTHTNIDVSYFENVLNEIIDVNFLEEGFTNIEELSNQQKLALLFYGSNDYITNLEEITVEQVDNYFKNNYNTTVNHESINCDINLNDENYCYTYDDENQKYIENFVDEEEKNNFLSNYMNRNLYSKVTDYIQENNTYTFTRYELYSNACYNNCNLNKEYFSNIKNANNNLNPLIIVPEEYIEQEIIDYNNNKMYTLILETNFEIYQNLMTSHTYTFKKIDNTYILQSYQINRLD